MKIMLQKSFACCFVLLFLCCAIAIAQPPALIKDINLSIADGAPKNMTAVGNTVFFSATETSHGRELWKSDGTSALTALVADINPLGDSYPSNLCNVNGTLFFAANNGTQGTELWKSNGTSAGTVLVKDINPNGSNSAPSQLFAVGSTVFFAAFHATLGNELWKSNGTAEGTVLVKDINPNAANSNPGNFIVFNGSLFFTATGSQGLELWKTDGTELGTVQVKNINLNGDASPQNLTIFNNQLFFSATTTVNGVADRELWKTNGTGAGTIQVKNINPATSSNPTFLKVFNGALFFAAMSQSNGLEMYKSDGTEAGTPTIPTFDLQTGASSSNPGNLTVANNTLFFVMTTPFGRELWKLTTTGFFSLVKDIAPLANSSFPQALTTVGNKLFFTASNSASGRELWVSDASEAGTFMVQNLVANAGNSGISETDLCVRGLDLFFSSNGVGGNELRRSNGTLNAVVNIRDIGQAGSFPTSFTKMGNLTFFVADDGVNGRELWKTDGTLLGTKMVKNIAAGAVSSNPTELTVVTNGNVSTLFFVASDPRCLFKSDGTDAGTVQVQTVFILGVGQNPTNLTAFQGKLFFTATNTFHSPVNPIIEERLFSSDGTQDGTQQVNNSPLAPRFLTVLGDKLMYSAIDANGRELWSTSSNQSIRVKNINIVAGDGNPSNLIAIGNTLFFSATDGVNGIEIYKSNGSVGNATKISSFRFPGPKLRRIYELQRSAVF